MSVTVTSAAADGRPGVKRLQDLGAGAGQPVKVCVQVDHDHVVLTVTDGGPGPAADGERAFEPRRGERDEGNLGLGLWLVRELTRAMGGQVAAAAAPGAGTTFMVRLPRSGR